MFINQNFFTLNKSQKGRIKKNIFSGFSTEIFQIVSQIFFAPLMILFWGVDNFGTHVLYLFKLPRARPAPGRGARSRRLGTTDDPRRTTHSQKLRLVYGMYTNVRYTERARTHSN